MNRSASESGVVGAPRRVRKLPTVRDPESGFEGWKSNPVYTGGPRWTISKTGAPNDVGTTRGGRRVYGTRETWIGVAEREKKWVPGPGAYRSDREFLLNKEDEIDSNRTIQECAPDFSFPRDIKETSVRPEDVKPKRNHAYYPKFDNQFTPGPGSYTQFTGVGAASGGHRQTWLGGTAADPVRR